MKTVIVSENALFGEVIKESARECLCDELVELEPDIGSEELSLLEPDVIILDESIPMEIKERIFSAACHLSRCRILMVNLFNNDFVVLNSTRSTLQKANDLKKALTIETGKNEFDFETFEDKPNGPTMAGGENDVIEQGNQTDEPRN